MDLHGIYAAIEQAFGGLKFKSASLKKEIDQIFCPVNCSQLDLHSLQGGFSISSVIIIMMMIPVTIIIIIIIIIIIYYY